MEHSGILDDEAKKILRAKEIARTEQDLLFRVANELVKAGSSSFEFGSKRFLLTKSGLSYNPGYQIESENLDGSGLFRHSWSALSGDLDWQVSCIINKVSHLLATRSVSE